MWNGPKQAGRALDTLALTTPVLLGSLCMGRDSSGAGECIRSVDGRTSAQWLRSAIAYCDFRAGNAWRSLATASDRHSSERWEYMRAVRLLTDILSAPVPEPKGLHLALPVLNPAPAPLAADMYTDWPRKAIAAHMVRCYPHKWQDAKLLSGLRRDKLRRMLAEAEGEAMARGPVLVVA